MKLAKGSSMIGLMTASLVTFATTGLGQPSQCFRLKDVPAGYLDQFVGPGFSLDIANIVQIADTGPSNCRYVSESGAATLSHADTTTVKIFHDNSVTTATALNSLFPVSNGLHPYGIASIGSEGEGYKTILTGMSLEGGTHIEGWAYCLESGSGIKLPTGLSFHPRNSSEGMAVATLGDAFYVAGHIHDGSIAKTYPSIWTLELDLQGNILIVDHDIYFTNTGNGQLSEIYSAIDGEGEPSVVAVGAAYIDVLNKAALSDIPEEIAEIRSRPLPVSMNAFLVDVAGVDQAELDALNIAFGQVWERTDDHIVGQLTDLTSNQTRGYIINLLPATMARIAFQSESEGRLRHWIADALASMIELE